MTEAMNKYTAPRLLRIPYFGRLIGNYATYRYMPEFPDDEEPEVDLEAFAKDIDACALAGMSRVIKDLETDGFTDVSDSEALRISRCIVLDDLRTLADAEIE